MTVHKDALKAKSRHRKIDKNRCTFITPTVHKSELPTVHEPKLDNGQGFEIIQSGEVHISEHPSISWGGVHNGERGEPTSQENPSSLSPQPTSPPAKPSSALKLLETKLMKRQSAAMSK